jgi:hypothetical protein
MLIGVLTVIMVAFVEFLLSAAWAPAYFRFGLALFEKQFSFSTEPARDLSDKELSAEFRGGVGPSMVFCRLSPDELAFRKRIFEIRLFNFSPVMHGIARIGRREHTVTVTGYVNWYPVVFTAFWIGATISLVSPEGPWVCAIWALGAPTVIGVCWLLEQSLYRRVYRRLQEHYGVR